ncbi:MAG: MFS transporter [Planctomycetes bacterium]|nr:MFS transporter [Planctomycetota bacterium]
MTLDPPQPVRETAAMLPTVSAPPGEPDLWRNIWTLSATIFCTVTFIYSWARILSNYYRHLGAGPELIGWCFLLFTMANKVPGALGGWLSDRLGRKRMIIAGTTLMGLGYVGVAHASTPALLTGAMCYTWIVGALLHPSLVAIQAESVPVARRGTAMATVESCAMAGIMLGPLIEALVFEWTGSIRSTFGLMVLLTSAVYMLVAVARFVFLRETDRRRHERTPFRPDWRRLSIPLGITVCFVGAMLITIDGPAVPLYIVDVTAGDEATVGYVYFFGGALAIAGALLGGWLADAWGAARVMAVAAGATALCFLPFAWPGTPPQFDRALIALVFLPIEAFVIANQKLVASIGPPGRRGLYVGMVVTSTGFVSSWGVVASGYLYAGRNPAAPMLAAMGLALVSLLLTLRLLRGSGRTEHPGHVD